MNGLRWEMWHVTFQDLLVKQAVPQDVERYPGHVEGKDHQGELLPQLQPLLTQLR